MAEAGWVGVLLLVVAREAAEAVLAVGGCGVQEYQQSE